MFWQLTICTMVQKLWIYLLRLLRYDFFFKIFNFDFRFGQEVKVKLGSLFLNIFWQTTICTMVQNCEFTSCGCWDMIFWILNFDFRFGQEVQIGVTFCKYFLTINDLYNGAKIVNCTSCGCWDMFFCNTLTSGLDRK